MFDASAKVKGGISLNEVLYKGPCLNADLYSLMLKFRIYPIAITADIEKAYLQINIDKTHRDYLRFLWFSNLSEKDSTIVKYRFTKVVFGLTSSQFLLNGTVQTHAKKYEEIDPEFTRKARKNFYVDDLNTGVFSTEEGFEVFKKMKERLKEANFNLRKWRTNDKDLQNLIFNYENKQGMHAEAIHTDINDEKVLGHYWNNELDEISLNIHEIFKNAIDVRPTKRNI